MKPLISFCMPTYNRAEYLPEAIESIIAQTYKNWELIVVDDASTDSTPQLMEYYLEKYPNIHYKRHIENQGIAQTRNDAIALAQGEYIAIHDSDDVSMRERLKTAIETLEKTKADVFYSAYARADEHGNIRDGIVPTDEVTAEEIKFNGCVPHATIVAKKTCFTDHPYRNELTVNDDYYLIWDWFLAGYIFCMSEEPLYMVRFHPQSVSVTRQSEADQISTKIRKEIDEYIKAH